MIAAGPRSPTPDAPFTYVTTKGFLSYFGLDTLRDLPDIGALKDAGLLNDDASAASTLHIGGTDEGGREEGFST